MKLIERMKYVSMGSGKVVTVVVGKMSGELKTTRVGILLESSLDVEGATFSFTVRHSLPPWPPLEFESSILAKIRPSRANQ